MSNISFSDFMGFLTQLDIGQLQSLRHALDNVISSKVTSLTPPIKVNVNVEPQEPANINDFVTYDGVPFLDEVTMDLLSAEFESFNFKSKSNKNCVQNVFLSSVVDEYNWDSPNGTVIHGATDMDPFPTVKGIMVNMNKKLGTKLNSALVSYYKDGNVGTGLHDDAEETMDPSQPICVFSYGVDRRVEFHIKQQTGVSKSVLTLKPVNGSLYVMKAGCQDRFRHKVVKDKRVKHSRISISFRCFVPVPSASGSGSDLQTPSPAEASTPVKPADVSATKTPTSEVTTKPQIASTPDLSLGSQGFSPFPGHHDDTWPVVSNYEDSKGVIKNKICLIFGSSITAGVDGDRMSRGRRQVINLSSSGFRISDVNQSAHEFCKDNPGVSSAVDKIVINIGTNEVKYFNCHRRSIGIFRKPLCNLIQSLKYLFGRAQIIFQSILPVEICYNYTADAVHGFNELLCNLCHEFGCIFFDSFGLFLDFSGYYVNINSSLYADAGMKMKLHLNDNGLKVLCRELKFLIYHNTFNPYASIDSYYYAYGYA